jgi:hypothetical protein
VAERLFKPGICEDRAVTITRVGPNQKYAEGWDKAFAGKRGGGKSTAQKAAPSKKAKPKKTGQKGRK